MFQHLKTYSKILVTGPQRSGTTICSHMIAHDTGFQHVDEIDFHVRDRATFDTFIYSKEPSVIHCPAMAYIIHEYGSIDNLLVVWLIRPLNEIKASQKRIGWGEIKERINYKALEDKRHIAQIKRQWWQDKQRLLCDNWLEVQYRSLQQHELWIEDRSGFDARQWQR